MKLSTTSAGDLREAGRIDAEYFLDGAGAIRAALRTRTGLTRKLIGDVGTAYAPSRFKRTYAVEGEEFVSYLRPYDVFEFLPPEADRLSKTRTAGLENYLIREGDLLQTCSGRNLGPVTIADSYLARFALSHDMVRIRIDDAATRLYVLAFLRSRTGQVLLRADRGGSVISHITTSHVEALEVPVIGAIEAAVVDAAGRGTQLREAARVALHASVEGVERAFPASRATLRDGWTVSAGSLRDRFDAAQHAQPTRNDRASLLAAGGVRLGDVAEVVKPAGRHKMVYVEPGQGPAFLSGRQILQCDVVAAKHLSPHSAQAAGGFALREHSIIFQADGRAEEGLGYPAYVTHERDDWLASGHVGRAVPFNAADAGWIWASMAADVVRRQVVAQSCGSVVDALYPEDLEDVILPPRHAVDSAAVRDAWMNMAEGSQLLAQAADMIDEALGFA